MVVLAAVGGLALGGMVGWLVGPLGGSTAEPLRAPAAVAVGPGPGTTGPTPEPIVEPDLGGLDDPTSGPSAVQSGDTIDRADRSWTIDDAAGWDADAMLNALVGTDDDGDQFVFFWVAGDLIGTDTLEPSRSLTISWRSGDAVEVVYDVWDPGMPRDEEPVGNVAVAYVWDGVRLVPLDDIPSTDDAQPQARR